MARLTGRWRLIASTPRLQRSSQALSVFGTRAYIFGGELQPRQPIDNQVDVVELQGSDSSKATSTLATASDAPSPRVGSPSTVARDGLYIFSGRGGVAMAPVEEHGALWRFDRQSQSWMNLEPADSSASYPAGRSYHCLTSDSLDTIYVHAGCPEKGRLADLWSFDLESRVWTELPAAPAPARGGASVAWADGKVYRMNGFDGSTEQGGAVDVYDTASQAWSTIVFKPDGVEGPEPRSVSALMVVKIQRKNYLVTMFGEHDPSSLGHAGAGKMLADVWAFDIDGKAWTKVEFAGESPAPRGWFDADVASMVGENDRVIVHGGLAEDNSRLGDIWELRFE